MSKLWWEKHRPLKTKDKTIVPVKAIANKEALAE